MVDPFVSHVGNGALSIADPDFCDETPNTLSGPSTDKLAVPLTMGKFQNHHAIIGLVFQPRISGENFS